jgi:PAS domain S-box-containing protein
VVTPGDTVPENYSHLKSKKGGISLHPAVRKMADLKQSEQGYKSRSAYIAGLVVYDMYCGQKHNLTVELMNGPIELQEKVFAELLEHPGKETSWFKHRIEEIAARHNDTGRSQAKAKVQTDQEGRITQVNRAFTKMCGFTSKQLNGKKPGEILQGPDTELEIVRDFSQAIRQRRPFECVMTNYDARGKSYRVHIIMTPIFKKGELIGFEAEEERVK